MFSRLTARFKNVFTASRVVWFGGAALTALLVAASTFFMSTRTVSRIDVEGANHAPVSTLVSATGIVVGDTLYRIDPELVESRLALHPWVESTEVRRWPTGVVSIEVKERTPVVLLLSDSGRPTDYLDRVGTFLPVDSVSRYDVPLMRGLSRSGRSVAVRDSSILEFLEALASVSPTVNGLLSDILVSSDGQVDAITVPAHDGRTVRVRLGAGEFDRKMRTLGAFWSQAVAGYPTKQIEWIDLRFRGQVVTKEGSVIS